MECKLKIVNISGWKNPTAHDSCWGIKCSKCGKVVATGLTKEQANKYFK